MKIKKPNWYPGRCMFHYTYVFASNGICGFSSVYLYLQKILLSGLPWVCELFNMKKKLITILNGIRDLEFFWAVRKAILENPQWRKTKSCETIRDDENSIFSCYMYSQLFLSRFFFYVSFKLRLVRYDIYSFQTIWLK